MYVNSWGQPPLGDPGQANKLYINKGRQHGGWGETNSTATSWLKVRPVNAAGHSTLLSAQVRVFESNTRVLAGGGLRMIDGGSGFGCQNAYDAYFGLTAAVEKGVGAFDIEVRLAGAAEWTTKTKNPKLGGVKPNQVLIAQV